MQIDMPAENDCDENVFITNHNECDRKTQKKYTRSAENAEIFPGYTSYDSVVVADDGVCERLLKIKNLISIRTMFAEAVNSRETCRWLMMMTVDIRMNAIWIANIEIAQLKN